MSGIDSAGQTDEGSQDVVNTWLDRLVVRLNALENGSVVYEISLDPREFFSI